MGRGRLERLRSVGATFYRGNHCDNNNKNDVPGNKMDNWFVKAEQKYGVTEPSFAWWQN